MTSRQSSLGIVAAFAIALSTSNARAQCNPTWGLDMLPPTGIEGSITGLAVLEGSQQTLLFVNGNNLTLNGAALSNPAQFDGLEWRSTGAGVVGLIGPMLAIDDGTGPLLYVGGQITQAGNVPVSRLARWDGNNWYAVPNTPGNVTALGAHDDGTGRALHAACVMSTSGPTMTQIFRRDGSTWTALGGLFTGGVSSLRSFDDGHGPSLFAAGGATQYVGTPIQNIARWNGTTWLPVEGATPHPPSGAVASPFISRLAVADDGSGPALYAAGTFAWTNPDTLLNIARWNGKDWSPLGAGLSGTFRGLSPFYDGVQSLLCAAGQLRIPSSPATVRYVVRWNGVDWAQFAPNPNGVPNSIASVNLPTGPALCIGGNNTYGVVHFESGAWTRLHPTTHGGIGASFIDQVFGMTVFDDGAGEALYVGGRYGYAGGAIIPYLARWKDGHFTPVGSPGIGGIVTALHVFDDGSGPALYVGGNFQTAGGIQARNIARWNGTAWSALGAGIGETAADVVWALENFDDGTGPALYVGGYFASAGGKPAHNIARWNGISWSPVGAGTDSVIASLKSFADANGSFLYAAGYFYTAGGVDARALARWNGKSWGQVGAGLTFPFEGAATGMGIFDDGRGAALYVSGDFTAAGGIPAKNIARWDGTNWSAVGEGLNGGAWDLKPFDDGSGPALYAGGFFTGAGGSSASRIARWNGMVWRPIGTGILADTTSNDPYERRVRTLQPFDDGHGPALYFGGHFNAVDGHYFQNIAKLIHAAPDSPTIVNATGGVLTFCAPSPVVLSVTAIGTPPITYQWRKNTGNLTDGPGISGATTPQLTLANLAPDVESAYSCVVTDGLCQVTSSAAYVSVTTSTPVITRQPDSQVVHAGAQVALIIAGGFGPRNTYQWRKNGAPVPPSVRVWGTDSTYLSISDARISDSGLYDCVITNGCGTTTSNPARLTVLGTVPPPGKPIGPIPADPG